MSEFGKYEKIRRDGGSPHMVWRTASEDGVRFAARIRLIRELFGLSILEAKRIHVECDHGLGLDEYQASLARGLEAALGESEREGSDPPRCYNPLAGLVGEAGRDLRRRSRFVEPQAANASFDTHAEADWVYTASGGGIPAHVERIDGGSVA